MMEWGLAGVAVIALGVAFELGRSMGESRWISPLYNDATLIGRARRRRRREKSDELEHYRAWHLAAHRNHDDIPF